MVGIYGWALVNKKKILIDAAREIIADAQRFQFANNFSKFTFSMVELNLNNFSHSLIVVFPTLG